MSPLNPELDARFRSTLTRAAKELTITESLPINVERICAKLQIETCRTLKTTRKARLSDHSQIQLPKILLPRSGFYSAFERYVIAHEIGHFVLVSTCFASPLGRSEYWQFEDLCNYFARLVLLPDAQIGNLACTVSTPKEALFLVAHLAKTAIVPWPTAAWRLAEFQPKFVLLNVKTRENHLGQREMRIDLSTLPRKQLQKKNLNEQTGLGRILKPFLLNKDLSSLDEGNMELDLITSESPALAGAINAFVMRGGRGEIWMSIQLKQ